MEGPASKDGGSSGGGLQRGLGTRRDGGGEGAPRSLRGKGEAPAAPVTVGLAKRGGVGIMAACPTAEDARRPAGVGER